MLVYACLFLDGSALDSISKALGNHSPRTLTFRTHTVKLFFDAVIRRMFRKQRERAAVFAAAQVELGFMLRDQEDDAIL